MSQPQTGILRGIYEFEDPAGTLLAVKVPYQGTVDLYSGTRVVVRPNQAALFIYNGKLTEVLLAGNHEIQTENFPLLTRLANWRFGFESPLRCELWFVALNLFTGRHWGTPSPVMASLPSVGALPIRAHGNYCLRVTSAKGFFLHFLNAQGSYDVSDMDQFIQGQLVELLPKALSAIAQVQELSVKQAEVAAKLEGLVNAKLEPYGLKLEATQVVALTPPDEVLEAIDEKLAMEVIGDKREYLLYKVANSLDQLKQGAPGVDHSQLMMSLMMSRSLLGGVAGAPAAPAASPGKTSPFSYVKCPGCQEYTDPANRFCPRRGKGL